MSQSNMQGKGVKPRRPLYWVGGLIVVVAAIAWYGSWRQPANFTQPLKLSTPPQFSSHQRDTIRIGVFNIHGCKGRDGKRDVGRIAQCIHDLDIVSLHEVRGSYGSNQAYELGDILGMSAVFAPTEWRWGRNDFGNGLLTNVELSQMHQIPLAMSGRAYRNALLTSFRLEDKTVQLLIAHVDLSEDRDRQLSAVTNLFLSLKTPALLLGDLNVKATDPRMRDLMATPGIRSALVATPGRGRDWVIMKGFRTVSAAVVDNEASDHAIVQTELQLLNKPKSVAPSPSRGQARQAGATREKH
ncbi:hypothetical protein Pan258_27060 [Symmachiella dynata]|uniref:endonuclease/exonuclease/phosphatase family protein n=1 Tax=Symmachiella dynata TaxID=2527995 RepID=UPI001187C40B|nr:endonuclease/exonuclease/phosphatase family protein [Symmachiella dynata]QDT48663.1 hypothetical protein Pan258_27060 [Symmachiella dynata]